MNEEKTRLELKYEAIKKEYKALTGEKHLQSDYVLHLLADKFFLEASTIYRIVSNSGHYADKTDK